MEGVGSRDLRHIEDDVGDATVAEATEPSIRSAERLAAAVEEECAAIRRVLRRIETAWLPALEREWQRAAAEAHESALGPMARARLVADGARAAAGVAAAVRQTAGEVARILSRVERLRAADAISAASLARVLREMAATAERVVSSAPGLRGEQRAWILDRLAEGWRRLRLRP
jgi:hypothetical protein